MATFYTEDTLVQQTTADYLEKSLGWNSVYAFNQEVFSPDPHLNPLPKGEDVALPSPSGRGAGGEGVWLGRTSDREVVLKFRLRAMLMKLNPGLPDVAYADAVRKITESVISQTMFSTNREKYELLRNGVQVAFCTDQGEQKKETLRVFDFGEPKNNDFLCVRELWVRGDLYRRRADIIGFVNGIPLLFVECKNVHRDLEVAYRENLADYKDTIPHLFHHNAIVMLGNGIEAKVGTITAHYNHFAEWKRLEENEPGAVDMETLLKGICDKRNFLDLIENFILFDDSTGKAVKILARNHQFLGVNRAVNAVAKRYASTARTLTPGPSPNGRGGQASTLTPGPSPNGRGGYQFAGLVERARELRQKQTPAEEVLWELVRNRQFLDLKFRRQHQFGDYILDFYCHEASLAVELDGDVHDTPERQAKDARRDAYLKSQGLQFVRIKNENFLNDPEAALRLIAEKISPHPLGEDSNEGSMLPSSSGRGAGSEGETQADLSRLGVFWHTQGSGKSYSMLFFTRKVHRRLGGNFTFVILTDRDDLDGQIYKTFAGCGVVNNDRDPCRAANGKHLERLLGQHKSYVFSLIQKFSKDVGEDRCYSDRSDVIVITDEAHRTQYGDLALNLRNALPNASYMGFTGTPLFSDDEITRRVFGEYVSTYDFQRAVEDGATVPLYYDARGERLGLATTDLNERIAEKLEDIEFEDIDQQQRLEQALLQDYHIITAKSRLEQVAEDFVEHYSTGWENGKAMMVCIDKVTCVKMHNLISKLWKKRIKQLAKELNKVDDEQEELYRLRQLGWMQETQMAVVVSEEQGEVARFKKEKLDIKPHRKLIKEGFEIPEKLRDRPEFMGLQRLDVDSAFKESAHPFRIVIVCAMWLTGFDVPSLSTLYIDKPLKAHTLMQAIARANRVSTGKNNGLIVDYCGILKNLRKALATFAGQGDGGRGGSGSGGTDPTRSMDELLEDLGESIEFVRSFLTKHDASLDEIKAQTGFGRNAAILKAKEAANTSDETRKRFEIMCRTVFQKFKACINDSRVNAYRPDRDAINVVYKHLQKDRESADISDIIRQLHEVIDEVVETEAPKVRDQKGEPYGTYDISKIDFERLKQEFERSPAKKTTVQNLRMVIEKRLKLMLERNPLRTDMQAHYEQLISEYNSEKSRLTIEQTFEELLRKSKEMDKEETRAAREGMSEESLAIFDLLKKPTLTPSEIKRIKAVSEELLTKLKKEVLKIHHWRDKEATRDTVQTTILNFLYDGEHGLPESQYNEKEITEMTSAVYRHIYRVYPEIPSPFYKTAVAS